jgi:hypothetical protein
MLLKRTLEYPPGHNSSLHPLLYPLERPALHHEVRELEEQRVERLDQVPRPAIHAAAPMSLTFKNLRRENVISVPSSVSRRRWSGRWRRR